MRRLKINAVMLSFVFVLFAIGDGKPTEEPERIYLRHSDKGLLLPIPQPERIELTRTDGKYLPYKLTYQEMELTYLGVYFITAYCPAECGGSWNTASGETCHRADYEHRLSEPTTCAISRSTHSFYEEFYLPDFDRTFVAEDTGSAVNGHHLDLFYEDYDDVLTFPTGYYEVYAIEWIETTVIVTEEDKEHLKTIPPLEYYRKKEGE